MYLDRVLLRRLDNCSKYCIAGGQTTESSITPFLPAQGKKKRVSVFGK